MTIVEQLQEDIKSAMRAKERERLTTLRSLMSELKNLVIDTGKELTDDVVAAIVSKGIKIRQDSVTTYEEADREDLAVIERSEIKIYKEYQPAQLSEDEIRTIVSEVIASTGASSAKDMGKVMGALMPKVKGKADGGIVNKIVKELLS